MASGVNLTSSAILYTFAVFIMTAITSDYGTGPAPSMPSTFALIPAQIPGAKHPAPAKKNRNRNNAQLKHVPDVSTNQFNILSDDDSAGDEVVYYPPTAAVVNASSSIPSTSTLADSTSVNSKTNSTYSRKNKVSRHGNLPDVHWRAIPMSHLRSHPNFRPLPPASSIANLPTKEHARYFRQDSWQWDYLHQGRCTTSQAAAALGFLEPRAALFLGIPKSLQRGGGGAWQRLSQDTSSIDRLDEMERILCESHARSNAGVQRWRPGSKESEKTWIEASQLRNRYPFSAKYIPTVTDEDLQVKKVQTKQHIKSTSPLSIRMNWGNAQEATSILTALNYFCNIDEETTIHEVGMCGAGFDDIHDCALNGLKIGASPDAIICHGNGTVEVLEVKNHCPFAWNRPAAASRGVGNRRSGKNKKKDRQRKNTHNERELSNAKLFSIRDFDLECKVPPVYIPQLMMEMFCIGDAVDLDKKSRQSQPICTSAIMVRQTATRGAIILRLRRDEDWLAEMKHFLGEFQERYVNAGVIPPDDFFYNEGDSERYHRFLQKTKDLSESVEQVAYIEHGRIQRSVMHKCATSCDSPPLFLDNIDVVT